MYLDTKNLTAGNSSTATAATAALAAPRAGRRMRKVWQPLRRLLTVGGKGRPSCQPHPNNVDLNNTQLLPQLEPLQADNSDSSKSTPDESISKFAELSLQQVHEELTQTPPPPNTPTLISSVYVEKVSAQSCNACHHGRNCQHTHHSSNISNISDRTAHSLNVSAVSHSTPTPAVTSSVTPAATLWDLPLPLQYISTDNGTFFWANTQERVDDDLLHAWLCQSFSQLPGTLC